MRASFVKVDERIFKKEFNVNPFLFNISNPISIVILWIKLASFLFFNRKNTTVVVCMFAGYHSFVPALLSKVLKLPLVIIAGGIDCVSFPSINYGNFTKNVLGWITCFSFRRAKKLVPISQYLVDSYSAYPPIEQERYQGILRYCPVDKSKIEIIYNGLDTEFWRPIKDARKPMSFLCIVYGMDNPTRRVLKGVDLIIETASKLPQCNFTFVGVNEEIEGLPENIYSIGFQSPEELRELYSDHEFYLQLSISEGFGNTLAEAMLCGCIPIGSAAGAIPMIIGHNGFLIHSRSSKELVKVIKEAVDCKSLEKMRIRGTESIRNRFSLLRREKELLKMLKEFTPK